MYIEVESNPNCESSVFLRFREQGPARPIRQVRLYERDSTGEWCWIAGVQGEGEATFCPAWAQPVEDSGAGLVYVVGGGIWGVRLKPAGNDDLWGLDCPGQWGEPYLVLADRRDIRYANEETV